MNQKHNQNTYHVNINLNSLKENVIQVNHGIAINVDVRVKKM